METGLIRILIILMNFMMKKFKYIYNLEKSVFKNLYQIVDDGQLTIADKQKLIDYDVNKLLVCKSNMLYNLTPKIYCMCCILNERILRFSEYNLALIKNKKTRKVLLEILNTGPNLSLILLVLCGKIFNSVNTEKITVTNFAVLLHELLNEFFIDNYKVKNSSFSLKIGIILFEILDSDFIYMDKTFKLFVKHGDNELQISLNNECKDVFRLLPEIGNHHPLLVCPSNYILENNYINKDRLVKFNMYHINCNCGIRNKYSHINERLISSVNYLQSQPFVINKVVLNHVMNNPIPYLYEFDNSKNIFLALKYESAERYLIDLNLTKIDDINKAKERFYKGQDSLYLFIKTLLYADLYKNETIYFNTYLDWRGRIYYNGYPLNPQAYKLCRRLLKLNNSNIMCSFDVTASGFQILGLLKQDRFLLEMTNFLNETKEDIYEYIMNKYRVYIYKEFSYKQHSFVTNIEFHKHIFNRKFIKNLSMCLIYTEGDFSRANKIEEELTNSSIKIERKDLMMLAILFKRCVYESIPSIAEMSKDFSMLLNECKERDVIYLESSKEHLSTVFSYPKQEIKRVVVTKYPIINNNDYFVVKEKKNLFVNIVPYKNDIAKLRRSLFPNFIHQVDSLILHKVVQESIKQHISLYTIHDCFVCDIKDERIINEIYLKSCIDVISNDKPLENMFQKNKCSLLKSATKLDGLITNKNKKILKNEIYDIINY